MSAHNIENELKEGPLSASGKALWIESASKYLIGWGPNNTAASDVILHVDTSMSAIDLEAVLTELAAGDIATLVADLDIAEADIAAENTTQGAPNAETTATTLTAAELLTKIITGTHSAGADVDYTLPAGATLDAAVSMAVGDAFDWSLINLSAAAADTITITAATGHTLVGSGLVASAHSTTGGAFGNAGRFRTRKTAADTFITYRIA